MSLGLYFTDKKKRLVVFWGVSFKFSRYGFLTPKLSPKLLKEYRDNYIPVLGYSLDSSVGAGLNSRANGNADHYNIDGFTSNSLHFGLILNMKFKPSIQYYRGSEKLEFNITNIDEFFSPNNNDNKYQGIIAKSANEVKIGISLILKNIFYYPYNFNVNLGYKWLDYGRLGLGDVNFSTLTNNHDFSSFSKQGKITLSISMMFLNYRNG